MKIQLSSSLCVVSCEPNRAEAIMLLSSAVVEHAALGFIFVVLSLLILAFAVLAVVILTVTNSCWYRCDVDGDPLLEDYNPLFVESDQVDSSEPIETVVGFTPKHAEIV